MRITSIFNLLIEEDYAKTFVGLNQSPAKLYISVRSLMKAIFSRIRVFSFVRKIFRSLNFKTVVVSE